MNMNFWRYKQYKRQYSGDYGMGGKDSNSLGAGSGFTDKTSVQMW